ncbi:MAG: hypothetical protein FJ386_04980 [Verrucomicrobia bacterium]|nr:hypothetical protein [Verrucomicrobiota bacterium]
MPFLARLLAWLIAASSLAGSAADGDPVPQPHHVWMESEYFRPLRGANFSFQQPSNTTRGSWSLSGPGVAPEWTQGGESEFLSIATRADETNAVVRRDIELPAAGAYTLWVRYADYRGRKEEFGVRIKQGDRSAEHTFGRGPVADELDPLALYWDWAFTWDSTVLVLEKGAATVELFVNAPSEARRQIDCLCLTTDKSYRPRGREKPDFAVWQVMRTFRATNAAPPNPNATVAPAAAEAPPIEPLIKSRPNHDIPKPWKISDGPPSFLWNVGQPWLDELKKPAAERLDFPFGVDGPLVKDFLAAFRTSAPPIFSHPLSGAVVHIPLYPAVFTNDSPFLDWLARNPDRRFAILLNYGEPRFTKDSDRAALRANFKKVEKQFAGFIAGESLSYAYPPAADLNARIGAAKSRADVLDALRELDTAATVKKFTNWFGAPLTPEETWAPINSCLSANMEAYAHALGAWGQRRIGHENTGNSPTLARRLAFLRGAARQFGARFFDYQSCNLGDAATMFSREAYFYPASSRYILDNQYDAWAGAGVNWLLKDYVLWHLAGVDAFYNEQGVDMFWKPGGNSAGDGFPVTLSPKGRVAEAVLRVAKKHPRGTQFTPVAFLLDEAHGWSQERFQPASFALDAELNPAVLAPGRHEAALRGWFDVAYFPAPETQNEPASGARQGYVSGVFGDIFDVIVTAPKRAAILKTYPAVVCAGEITVSLEWGRALRDYVRGGGTLVVCADQLSGPGVKELELPAFAPAVESSAFKWEPGGESFAAGTFRHRPMAAGRDRVLATAGNNIPLALVRRAGAGQLIAIGASLGLGFDERPVPVLALVMRHLAEGLVPVRVTGDVEWTLNRLDDGGWLVGLLNNRGVIKPQHGVLPTDHREAQTVTLRAPFAVTRSYECFTEQAVRWIPAGTNSQAVITVPAGSVRMVVVQTKL